MNEADLFFALLKYELTGTAPDGLTLDKETADAVFDFAKKHDLAAIAADALARLGIALSPEDEKRYAKELFLANYRSENNIRACEALCAVLEGEGIPHCPLKGAVLHRLYPASWMRTRCDLDVLVKEDDLDRAVNALKAAGYELHGIGSHDASMKSKEGVTVELHFKTVEDERLPKAAAVLNRIWDEATVEDGTRFRYRMSDETFYFYHIAHMAKHFTNGGCGIRSLVDLRLLDKIDGANVEGRIEKLREGGLLAFHTQMEKIVAHRFDGTEIGDDTKRVEAFLFGGGIYGSMIGRVAIGQRKRGGKFRYALSRIYLPYRSLVYRYPYLRTHKWLLPFFEVRRHFELVFGGSAKHSRAELRYNRKLDKKTAGEVEEMLALLEI